MEGVEWQRRASALVPGRAAPGPVPYGDGADSGCGSGRPEIRRNHAVRQENGFFPIAHRSGGKNDGTQREPRGQTGNCDACADATGQAAAIVMSVIRRKIAALFAVFMRTGSSRHGRGRADRAAAHKGKRAQNQENASRPLPHDQTYRAS